MRLLVTPCPIQSCTINGFVRWYPTITNYNPSSGFQVHQVHCKLPTCTWNAVCETIILTPEFFDLFEDWSRVCVQKVMMGLKCDHTTASMVELSEDLHVIGACLGWCESSAGVIADWYVDLWHVTCGLTFIFWTEIYLFIYFFLQKLNAGKLTIGITESVYRHRP